MFVNLFQAMIGEVLSSVRGGASVTAPVLSSACGSRQAAVSVSSLPFMTEGERTKFNRLVKAVVVRCASNEPFLLSRVGKSGGGSWCAGEVMTAFQMMSNDKLGGDSAFMNQLALTRQPEGNKGVSTSMFFCHYASETYTMVTFCAIVVESFRRQTNREWPIKFDFHHPQGPSTVVNKYVCPMKP